MERAEKQTNWIEEHCHARLFCLARPFRAQPYIWFFLHRIFTLKQPLVFLRKISAPMRDVMNALASTRYGLVDEHTAVYFRDVF